MSRTSALPALVATLTIAFALAGCVTTNRSTWSFYDECAAQTSSFIQMVECGKQRRLATCMPRNICSAQGTAFMQFADALVLSVRNKEMTEAEALRRFAEHKSQVIGAIRRDRAIVAAGEAAAGPTTCMRTGDIVNCF